VREAPEEVLNMKWATSAFTLGAAVAVLEDGSIVIWGDKRKGGSFAWTKPPVRSLNFGKKEQKKGEVDPSTLRVDTDVDESDKHRWIQEYKQNNNDKPKKSEVLYQDGDSGYRIATIIGIHLDDGEPYYTIRISGEEGERQTVAEKLKQIPRNYTGLGLL